MSNFELIGVAGVSVLGFIARRFIKKLFAKKRAEDTMSSVMEAAEREIKKTKKLALKEANRKPRKVIKKHPLKRSMS